ncbi:uncharacterized protein ACDP82_007386 isoform 1-T1 [Pangshura tecta]
MSAGLSLICVCKVLGDRKAGRILGPSEVRQENWIGGVVEMMDKILIPLPKRRGDSIRGTRKKEIQGLFKALKQQLVHSLILEHHLQLQTHDPMQLPSQDLHRENPIQLQMWGQRQQLFNGFTVESL